MTGKPQTYEKQIFTTQPVPNKHPTASRNSKRFDQPTYTSPTTTT